MSETISESEEFRRGFRDGFNKGAYSMIDKSPCPLPRIGSKEWGWRRHGLEWVCDAFGFEIREDPHPGRPQWFCSDLHANFAAVGSVRLAKRVVETEARYRWRRENGKKI